MSSPQPSNPDHAAALQSILGSLGVLTVAQLVDLFNTYGAAAGFAGLLHAAVPEIVGQHAQAAATVTAQWYDELIPNRPSPATPVVNLPPERIKKSIDWALHAPSGPMTLQPARPAAGLTTLTEAAPPDTSTVLSRLSGSTKRMVFDASRTTVIENSTGQTRYARYASANACAFCRLLATRSEQYLYRSSKSAQQVVGIGRGDRLRGTRQLGQKYHDHCRCIVVPIPAGQAWDAPSYVADWQKQYQAARDAVSPYPTTQAILAHMRANTDAA